MLNKVMERALNGQMKEEMYSSYLYLSMSAYCQSLNFKGFANWLKIQAEEEWEHAMKFYNFIVDRGGIVELPSLPKPPQDFGSPAKVFQAAYEHEKKITGLINKLYKLAEEKKDYATVQFLHWFIEEQVEEESQSSEIAEVLSKIGDKGSGIWMFDQKLGQRGNK